MTWFDANSQSSGGRSDKDDPEMESEEGYTDLNSKARKKSSRAGEHISSFTLCLQTHSLTNTSLCYIWAIVKSPKSAQILVSATKVADDIWEDTEKCDGSTDSATNLGVPVLTVPVQSGDWEEEACKGKHEVAAHVE